MVEARERTQRLNIVVSEPLYEALTEMAAMNNESKSDFVRKALETEIASRKIAALEKAAAGLAPLYENNADLLAFSSLDGEDFL